MTQSEPTGAESIRWNLTDLYAAPEALDADIEAFTTEAEAFSKRYHGRMAELSADQWAEALADFGSIQDRIGRAATYSFLLWSTKTTDPARGKLLQRVREAYTEASKKLLFLELEWIALEASTADALLASDALQPYRHYLEVQRGMAPHVLTEPEEKILAEKSVTGKAAWARFFDETLGAATFQVDGESLSEQEILARMHEADRTTRRDAALGFTDGLNDHLRTLTFVFNTMLAEKASDDRLRHYPSWLSGRNLSNEVADEIVDTLVAAVSGRFDLSRRHYALKRRLLGLDEMFDYDRYAPLPEADVSYDWSQAKDIVLSAYGSFHPEMASIARRFFDESWIDAAVTPGKRGGAFSHGAVPSAHPYVLMNFTGRVRDVQTLAHELGHGVHQYLSRDQGILHADTPLTTAETASVFGEMLVFKSLLEKEEDPAVRLAMLVAKIDDTMATVFRQISMHLFEAKVHNHRRTHGELTSDEIGFHWRETQEAMFDGSVTLGEHYDVWWSYIPHFIHTPGYVYAYAFGELLVLALYEEYLSRGASFADAYLGLLAAGGSDWPHNLVARLGVDLTARDFWDKGLDAVEALVEEAERLAAGR
ncbi:MAG: M3 family oligoendopeptidase [Rhodothermales bacterium]